MNTRRRLQILRNFGFATVGVWIGSFSAMAYNPQQIQQANCELIYLEKGTTAEGCATHVQTLKTDDRLKNRPDNIPEIQRQLDHLKSLERSSDNAVVTERLASVQSLKASLVTILRLVKQRKEILTPNNTPASSLDNSPSTPRSTRPAIPDCPPNPDALAKTAKTAGALVNLGNSLNRALEKDAPAMPARSAKERRDLLEAAQKLDARVPRKKKEANNVMKETSDTEATYLEGIHDLVLVEAALQDRVSQLEGNSSNRKTVQQLKAVQETLRTMKVGEVEQSGRQLLQALPRQKQDAYTEYCAAFEGNFQAIKTSAGPYFQGYRQLSTLIADIKNAPNSPAHKELNQVLTSLNLKSTSAGRDPIVQLEDRLILPIQRIPRYQLLVKALTDPASEALVPGPQTEDVLNRLKSLNNTIIDAAVELNAKQAPAKK